MTEQKPTYITRKRNDYPDETKAERARRRYAYQDAAARLMGVESWQKLGTKFRQAIESAAGDEAQARKNLDNLLSALAVENLCHMPPKDIPLKPLNLEVPEPKKKGYKKDAPA